MSLMVLGTPATQRAAEHGLPHKWQTTLVLHTSTHVRGSAAHQAPVPQANGMGLPNRLQQVAKHLCHHLVLIKYLVPTTSTFVGASDESKEGMGGIWYPTSLAMDSGLEKKDNAGGGFTWLAPFPSYI